MYILRGGLCAVLLWFGTTLSLLENPDICHIPDSIRSWGSSLDLHAPVHALGAPPSPLPVWGSPSDTHFLSVFLQTCMSTHSPLPVPLFAADQESTYAHVNPEHSCSTNSSKHYMAFMRCQLLFLQHLLTHLTLIPTL